MNSSLLKWLERNINKVLLLSLIAIVLFPWLLSLPAFCSFFDITGGGSVGDAIGGITAPIIGIVSISLLVLTLKAQKEADYHSQLENRIFQLIRLHKDNVVAMHSISSEADLNGQEVFKLISKQIASCVSEIRPFINRVQESELLSDHFAPVFDKLKLNVEKKQFVLLDIAFSIVYIGTGKDSMDQLKSILCQRYNSDLINTIIAIERLKPALSAEKTRAQWNKWNRISDERKVKLLPLFELPYEEMSDDDSALIRASYDLLHKGSYKKYYWGHQFRLSHYYRHLLMVIEYITNIEGLSPEQKYEYVKILRAQLSTTEQILLMANSISQLGGEWELFRKDEIKYITTYNLIKNIPQSTVFGVEYRKIYPKVKYQI